MDINQGLKVSLIEKSYYVYSVMCVCCNVYVHMYVCAIVKLIHECCSLIHI